MTFLHIPGHDWWYAVTVINYYSRYLLACHFTGSYSTPEVATALDAARAEAERIHGPFTKTSFLVTDNGSSFLARHFRRHIDGRYAHVRIQYRTPMQLGLLERFHLKTEEVYWRLYASPYEARTSLEAFRQRYNEIRPYWALTPSGERDPLTPADVYIHGPYRGVAKVAGLGESRQGEVEENDRGRASAMEHAPCNRNGCLMPVSTLTKSGRTSPVDFGAKTIPSPTDFFDNQKFGPIERNFVPK